MILSSVKRSANEKAVVWNTSGSNTRCLTLLGASSSSCCLVTKSCLTLCDPMDCSRQASLSFTIFQSLLRLMSIESVRPSNHLNLCCPLLILSSIFLSINVFSSEWVLRIRWPKYWNFRISPSNEYSGLISLRIDWFDLLSVQGTLQSFHQHHNLNASIFEHSASSHIHT